MLHYRLGIVLISRLPPVRIGLDIAGQIPLKLSLILDDYTEAHLLDRRQYTAFRASGLDLVNEDFLTGPEDTSSCPWEDLNWTPCEDEEDLQPLYPRHMSVLLFFSFSATPKLAWALNLYSQAPKNSVKEFLLFTRALLRPYNYYLDNQLLFNYFYWLKISIVNFCQYS